MKLNLNNEKIFKVNICENLKYPEENDIITIQDEHGKCKTRVVKINEGKYPWETTLTVEKINTNNEINLRDLYEEWCEYIGAYADERIIVNQFIEYVEEKMKSV